MTLLHTTALLYPQVSFPDDPGLSDLPNLFDADWVWNAYRGLAPTQAAVPSRFRIRQFAHGLGRTVIVSYEVEWAPDEYLPSELFAAKVNSEGPAEIFRYPDDPYLPGLIQAAHPETALRLVNDLLVAMRARRTGVELVRYRPTARAVLCHTVGKVKFLARVMRPDMLPSVLSAYGVISKSDFVAPRLAGHWAEGGIVWLAEIPGQNLRRNILRGKTPDSDRLLNGLDSLWNNVPEGNNGRPFNLSGAYRSAKRTFRHNVLKDSYTWKVLGEAVRSLDPFVESWRPAGTAHNDFYDDQMLALPDGRVALVDFEETGPGDPMLDVGNFLAHLRWRTHLGRRRGSDAGAAYHEEFRSAALDRFGWSERELAFRESVCLFRICTNTIRHPQPDWPRRLEAGLALVNETLG